MDGGWNLALMALMMNQRPHTHEGFVSCLVIGLQVMGLKYVLDGQPTRDHNLRPTIYANINMHHFR